MRTLLAVTSIMALLTGCAAPMNQQGRSRAASEMTRREIPPPTVDTKYDAYKELTSVEVKLEPSFHEPYVESISAILFTVCEGRGPCSGQPTAALSFFSHASEWTFLRLHALDILADEERIALGEGQHDGRVLSGRLLSENVYFGAVSRADLMKIASAKVVRVRLGTVEMTLATSDRAAIKEFLAATSDPASTPVTESAPAGRRPIVSAD